MRQPDSDKPADSLPIASQQIETPRGGFMARPGLKTPPRHAVVIRAGEAPEAGDIPVARSSFLPPPPPSEPMFDGAIDRVTVRAIPTARVPDIALPHALGASSSTAATPTTAHLPPAPRVVESAPPPSDVPVMASLMPVARSTPVPASTARTQRTWLTIVAAAIAGLILGIISVVTTVRLQEAQLAPAAAQPRGVEIAAAPTAVATVRPPSPSSTAASPARVTPSAAPSAALTTLRPTGSAGNAGAAVSPKSRGPESRRSIF